MSINKLNIIFNSGDCVSTDTMIEYLNGKLSEKENNRIEMHFQSCQMCKDEFDGLAEMTNPKDITLFVSDINTRINERVNQKPTKNPFFRKNFLQIAAVFIILISSTFFINNYINQSAKDLQSSESVSQNLPVEEVFIEEADESVEIVEEETVSEGDKSPTIADKEFQDKTNLNRSAEEKLLEAMHKEKSKLKEDKINDEVKAIVSTDDAIVEEEIEGPTVTKEINEDLDENKNLNSVALGENTDVKRVNDNESEIAMEDEMVVADYKERKQERTKKQRNFFFSNKKLSKSRSSQEKPIVNTKKVKANKADNNSAGKGVSSNYSKDIVSQSQSVVSYRKGIKSYNEDKYSSAKKHFKQSIKYQKDNTKAMYYLGLTYLNQNSNKKALENFNQVLKYENSSYYIDALWQKANVLIETGKRKSAINILNDIHLDKGKYSKDAKSKLDSMEIN